MSNNKTHTEKTAAESKSIGFDYQYYFFLWKVLLLQPNESVGLEVKDDVHTELSNNHQVLYQLKHTIKKNKDDSIANLTTSDLDMWKTFSNWSKVISDENDSRSTIQAQLSFIEKTSFVLASNKSSNNSNKVVCLVLKKVYTFYLNPGLNLHLFLILFYVYTLLFLHLSIET
jgi:hypothetical protein